MELNGVANIKMLLDGVKNKMVQDEELKEAAVDIYKQLEYLERYMKVYHLWANKLLWVLEFVYREEQNRPPYWHEVRDKNGAYEEYRREVEIEK